MRSSYIRNPGPNCPASLHASGKRSVAVKHSSATLRPIPSVYGSSSAHGPICSAKSGSSGKPSVTVKKPGSSSTAAASSGSRFAGCHASYAHMPTPTLAPSTSSSTHISYKLGHRQTCPPTLPASVLYTVTATSTPSTTQGPATVTLNNWQYTAYGEDGAVTACGSSSISTVQGYPVTKCAGSTSLIHSAISYSTSINVSPNGVLDYGNWSNFESEDWDKENDTTRSSSLYSAFYSGLSTLCVDSSASTVMHVTETSIDVDKATIATITTSTTMHQCATGAKATPNVENIRYTADDEDERAKLSISVPFSHFDPGHINNWMNLTAFALVANAMQKNNTWEGDYMLSTGRGPGAEEHIVQHTGPSLVDLTYFSSINEGILEQLQVQVHFKSSESEFDCALMETAELFIDAALVFFDAEVAVADLLPEEMELNTLCDLANGD
ncbi:uncharacterized protein N7459_001578 [Penicillium hispanicum]|uniref:uncharacterized protein n=1 Tax=Penicillium hispanicum TaxID=1080232 RepID=UPI0025412FC7|nr:uncharacterized protein N7459_001578 [Penicillium hispanicum]KAJ5595370.1 hypothetical protein N7459_001578 [Penicillium hispanicum]